MANFDFSALESFFQTHLGWASGLAAAVFGLAIFLSSVLKTGPGGPKETLSLWLMGAQQEESWAKSFNQLFDAVFGKKHFTLQCFLRSCFASIIAVVLLWVLMGSFGVYGSRIKIDHSFWVILTLALTTNVFADYLSLLETRWILGWLEKPRAIYVQFGILILDLMISALIIWGAIFLISRVTPIELESFAEVVGVFSIYSVLFYSTFLTSFWSWVYVVSSWILRLFGRWKLSEFLEVERKPMHVLGLVMAIVVFIGSLSSAAILRKDASGLTIVEQALCSVTEGPICLAMAGIVDDRVFQTDMLHLACEGAPEGCLSRALDVLPFSIETWATSWNISCDAGSKASCTSLALLYMLGVGVDLDHQRAAQLLRKPCEENYSEACAYLGLITQRKADYKEAMRLYRKACDGGSSNGCRYAEGLVYEYGTD